MGYMEISIFVKAEEAPAFNFLIRVFTPVVYIIIISTILYFYKQDKYVHDIYLVNLYYIIFRLIFNLLTNRGLLLNWYRQILYWIAIIVVSYFVYDKLIKEKANILPDFSTIANELWIIILVFIFQIANNIRTSNAQTTKRKQNYIQSRYRLFNTKYGQLINLKTKNDVLRSLIYSIMIYEDFNRPKLIRILESILHKFSRRPHTLGVMQIKTDKLLTDTESVILGAEKIINSYRQYINLIEKDSQEYYSDISVCNSIIEDYNVGDRYKSEVIDLMTIIKDTYYKDTEDTLDPKKNTI